MQCSNITLGPVDCDDGYYSIVGKVSILLSAVYERYLSDKLYCYDVMLSLTQCSLLDLFAT